MKALRTRWGVLGAALVAAALGSCTPDLPKPSKEPLEVAVVEMKPENVPIYQDFIGTIDGIDNAEIRARVAGYLEKVHYKEGAPVKAGDLLFTIDPVLTQAAVRQSSGDVALAKAKVDKARADVERLRPLIATRAVSQQELDHAEAELQSGLAEVAAAEGSLATARANLDYTKVKSPIDGIAGVKNVSIGTLVGQDGPTLLTTVSRLDKVKVRFPISEQLYIKYAADLNRLSTLPDDREGRLQLVLADGSVYPHKGYLTLIDRAVKASTGTITLEARFPNPEGKLRPGQFARVRAQVDDLKNALALPQRAVLERQSLHQVYVLGEGNKVALKNVEVGPRVGPYWVITKGLQTGDKVLVEGFQKIKPGAVVVPKVKPLGDVKTAAYGTATEPEAPGEEPKVPGAPESPPAASAAEPEATGSKPAAAGATPKPKAPAKPGAASTPTPPAAGSSR